MLPGVSLDNVKESLVTPENLEKYTVEYQDILAAQSIIKDYQQPRWKFISNPCGVLIHQ